MNILKKEKKKRKSIKKKTGEKKTDFLFFSHRKRLNILRQNLMAYSLFGCFFFARFWKSFFFYFSFQYTKLFEFMSTLLLIWKVFFLLQKVCLWTGCSKDIFFNFSLKKFSRQWSWSEWNGLIEESFILNILCNRIAFSNLV